MKKQENETKTFVSEPEINKRLHAAAKFYGVTNSEIIRLGIQCIYQEVKNQNKEWQDAVKKGKLDEEFFQFQVGKLIKKIENRIDGLIKLKAGNPKYVKQKHLSKKVHNHEQLSLI